MMVKNIRHTGIVVHDLQKAMDFYMGLLGFKLVKRADEAAQFIDTILGISNTTVTTVKLSINDHNLIELLYYKKQDSTTLPSKRINNYGYTHIALTVDDVAKMYNTLISEGIEFISSPQQSPAGYAKVAFCQDPEGNFIELVELI